MSFYVATTGALTNTVTTLTTEDLLALRTDPAFDLLDFNPSQQNHENVLQPAMRLSQYAYQPLKEASDSSRDSDTSTEDDTARQTQRLLAAEMSKGPSAKPTLSYIALISMAIQSTPEKKMLLSEIYQWITDNFPYYRQKDKSWRNSIRHNLSLNECFIKNGRSDNGKGNYWSIHPANVEDFGSGDFRRRRARRRVRKCDEMQRMYQEGRIIPEPTYYETTSDTYVPMMSTCASAPVLSNWFGADNVLSREEQLQRYYEQLSNVKPLPSISTVPSLYPNNQMNDMGYQPTVPEASTMTTVQSVTSVQISVPSVSSVQDTTSFEDNFFTPQTQTQTLPSISFSGPLPSWQDTLSRLQSDLGGSV